eukprot:scaffold13947_cov108-Isochrysis_galbana.AAC.2
MVASGSNVCASRRAARAAPSAPMRPPPASAVGATVWPRRPAIPPCLGALKDTPEPLEDELVSCGATFLRLKAPLAIWSKSPARMSLPTSPTRGAALRSFVRIRLNCIDLTQVGPVLYLREQGAARFVASRGPAGRGVLSLAQRRQWRRQTGLACAWRWWARG